MEDYVSAMISVAIVKINKSDKADKVFKKVEKVMQEFALLCDANPEAYQEEEDCLLEFMGKMTVLQLKRKKQFAEASHLASVNEAFVRTKHAPGAC